MIHLKHKLVYIHIPKTGGTSIEMALTGYRDESGTDRLIRTLRGLTTDEFHIPCRRSSHRHAPYSYYRSYIEDVLGAEIGDYTLFTSIRNPWARIVSGFHYAQQRGRANRGRSLSITILRRYYIPGLADRLFGPKIGILTYMICTANDSLRDSIDFWLENNDVDYVLRCESLNVDFASMCGALNLTLPLETYNKSKTVAYQEYYNWFSRRLVGWAHRNFIRRFGYRFD